MLGAWASSALPAAPRQLELGEEVFLEATIQRPPFDAHDGAAARLDVVHLHLIRPLGSAEHVDISARGQDLEEPTGLVVVLDLHGHVTVLPDPQRAEAVAAVASMLRCRRAGLDDEAVVTVHDLRA